MRKYHDIDLLIWDDNKPQKVIINGAAAFDFYQKYGFPVEMFEEEVNQAFKDINVRAYHTTKAYDKAHGTNFLEQLNNN